MFAASQIIFTTGAARHREPRVLAEEMSGIEQLFSLPCAGASEQQINSENLIDKDDVTRLVSRISADVRSVSINHLISLSAFAALAAVPPASSHGLEIVVSDPLTLLLAGEPRDTVDVLRRLRDGGIDVTYRRKPLLSAVTINPFYPDLQLFTYTTAYIDKDELKSAMRTALSIPVFNMKEDDAENLFKLLVQ
jgi:hypothetical protein